MKRFLNFFIHTNVYIALGAVALTLETQVQLGIAPQFHPYLLLIFFATLFDYNLHRFITVITHKDAIDNPKHRWIKNNRPFFYTLVVASVVGFFWTALAADRRVLLTLAPLGALTFFYSLPVFKKGKSLFRLREIPALKIFLIAFVWSATTILLPYIYFDKTIGATRMALLLAERFLFVFAITIPFDVRDMASDAATGLKTIPLLLGKLRAMQLANGAILLFLLICGLQYWPQPWLMAALFISGGSTYFLLNSDRLQSKYLYHYAVLDGTLLLQGLLVGGGYFLHWLH